MHVKRIHSMLESLTECAESALKNDQTHVGKYPISEVIDMIKDLSEAEYHSKITHAMDEEKEEEEKQDEYALMRMKEEYGEDDGQRYYNEWRYANGRYAPKWRGSRRGYTVPIRYLISPKSGYMSPEEYERDMDRWDNDRMYYTDHSSNSGNMNRSGSGMSNMNGSNSMRSYEDGYNEGNRRGYEDGDRSGYNRGYSEGEQRGRSMNQRDSREGRSGQSRRSYMESKEMHADNSPESKQAKMRELEKYMNELSSDMSEMINGASNEEKTMLKTKLQTLQQKIV